jgi:HEAT repeat protein
LADAQPPEQEQAHHSILEMQLMDPQRFARIAVQVLSEKLSEGDLYLLCILLLNLNTDGLMDLLTEPARPDGSLARKLARWLGRHDSNLSSKLLKYLSEETKRDDVNQARIERALELLTDLPETRLSVPYLLELLRSTNIHIRSKVVLLMAKSSQGSRWTEFRLSEADPRVRANAIEGLWNLQLRGSEQVLRGATRDPHHRVVVNAWIGLHYIGDEKAAEELVRMAAHEDSACRAAAVWGLGHLGLMQFQPVLQRLVRDPDALVRRNALRALIKIRKKLGGTPEPPEVTAA